MQAEAGSADSLIDVAFVGCVTVWIACEDWSYKTLLDWGRAWRQGLFPSVAVSIFSQDLISKPLRSHNVVVSWWWYGHPNPVTGPWDLLIYSIIIIALISVFGIFGSHWTASARLKLGSPKSIRYTI